MKGLSEWVNARFPLAKTWKAHASEYHVPRNLNFWYYFGSLALLVLVIQLLSGIWLTMFYTPSAKDAFDSVEYIMRDVHFGWILRYTHSTGASAFFIVIYLHIFRALLYGSYKKPRELVWLLGMLLFVLLMSEAFFGYLLPWGQMSYWGAQVITSLFGAIPFIGDSLATWIRGDFTVANATLQRFFALHVIAIPLLFVMIVWLHMVALHAVGSNNPEGIDIRKPKEGRAPTRDTLPFHPWYTVKDCSGAIVFLMLFFSVVFFFPEMGGYFLEHANFEAANPMVTPEHIAPVWYLTPFYAMLRAIPDKLFGVAVMGGAIVILFFLPWLDKSPVRSMRYKGRASRVALTLFVLSTAILGYLGTLPVTPLALWTARVCTAVYFGYFLLMPLYTRLEACKTPPEHLEEEHAHA